VKRMREKTEKRLKSGYLLFRAVFIGFFFCWWNTQGLEGATVERNPFDLPAGIQKAGTLPAKEGGSQGKNLRESIPRFRLTTILVSGRTRVAGINGILRQKGDDINGYRILDIEDKQVVLSRGNDRFVLKINSETGYFFKESNSNIWIMGFSK
jgi:hypothetical protein